MAIDINTIKKSKTAEYGIWKGMISRCEDPKNQAYENYGGRGIKVCWLWKYSFWLFLADMGFRPNKKFSLDRIDNNGNYEPGNCRWATSTTQALNKRQHPHVRLLEHDGQTKSVSAWARELDMSRPLIQHRLRLGWSVKDALTKPVRLYHRG